MENEPPKTENLVHKHKYTQEDVNEALEHIEKGMSTRKAAEVFRVPRSTLYAKNKKISPVIGIKGPPTYLTNKEEDVIVDWILYCRDRGFRITKSQLLECVQKVVTDLKRKTPFKNNKPGRRWYESFCRRHPVIAESISQNLSTSRAATEDILQSWFCKIKTHLQNLNLLDIHPSRIYNLDERAFFLNPKAKKILARKGSKPLYKDKIEKLIVFFVINADGSILPPMTLYWYDRIPSVVKNRLPSQWIAGNTDTGWMTADGFYNYITSYFYPWLVENKIEFPVVLYINGLSSCLTLALSQFCKVNQIELLALYPNPTNILQPLDLALFHSLKENWKHTVNHWRMNNGAQKLKMETFASVLKEALDALTDLPTVIKHSFKICGLAPFSENIDFNVLKESKKDSMESSESVNISGDQEENENQLDYFENQPSPHNIQNTEWSETWNISSNDNKDLLQYWINTKHLTDSL